MGASRVRRRVVAVVNSTLSRTATVRLAGRATRSKLRILAYHGVPDGAAFRAQLEDIVRSYVPVPAVDVRDAALHGRALPDRAVWLTFDDGDPSVVHVAQPVLDALGVPASMFVCPSVIDTDRPLWFQAVDIAIAAGAVPRLAGQPVAPDVFLRQLKRVSDLERRSVVECLEDQVAVTGRPLHREQLTTSELRRWVAAGHEVGNHTWDHPCLPRCSDEQQTAQITRADDWLSGALPDYIPTFAYPNGDWSATAQRALEARGHALAVLFDHRLAGDAAVAPLRLSRLRLSADAELPRTRAIVSGAHSAASALLRSSA